ncbi:MAG: hypothetical protein ACI9U2_000857 [Bradymonadia bacterium]|jgi:hypothetical protein
MKNAAELLVGAVARALADERRVVLFGDSFELLQLLAEAPVKELVVVSSMVEELDASGQTTLGAPLRLRPATEAKLNERASSKDLVVDLDGTAPAADVKRVLKKSGIYLTAVPGPALAALAETTPIEGRFVTAVVTEGGRPVPVRLDKGDATDPIVVYMAGKSHVIAPPGLICTLPAALAPQLAHQAPDGADAPETAARIESFEAQVVDAENRVAHVESKVIDAESRVALLEGDLQDAEAQLNDQAIALEAAEELGQRMLILEDELMAARATRDYAEAALAPLKTQLAEVEAAYNSNRDELAERRVDDRRYASLRTRFDAARTELVAEVDELRGQLRMVGSEAEDISIVIAERNTTRQMFTLLTHRLVPALQAHLKLAIPSAPPVWTTDAVQGWLDTTCHLLVRHAERPSIAVTTQTIVAPPVLAIGPAPIHPQTVAIDDSTTQARIDALEAQLEAVSAERAATAAERAATAAAWHDRLAAADAALADREQLITELRASHSSAAQARLAHLAAEARAERLRAEVQLRDQRAGDLEGVIEAHVRMEGLLTEALDSAELTRDDAVTGQRALAANLRTLRAEFERATADSTS